MVLNLRTIQQSSDKNLTIVVRNHRDQKMTFLSPGADAPSTTDFNRWLHPGDGSTEINVTGWDGRAGTIILEDDENWGLVVSGNIDGGRKRVVVGGDRDFDVIFSQAGHVQLNCRGDFVWGEGSGSSLDFALVAFQK